MNPLFVATLAFAALSVADAIFLATTAAAGTAVTFGTPATLALGGTAGVLAAGGLIILKGLAIGALIGSSGRSRGHGHHKRSAEDNEDAAFIVLNYSEPAQCYRRLICDMAAGAVPDHDKILSLFDTEVSPVSPKFEYATAAKVGKMVKNASLCEVRYSCPLNSQQISKLFN